MNLNIPFRPKLLETLKGYSARDFMPDLIAGVTVGIVALPLAMAFGRYSEKRRRLTKQAWH